MNPQEKRVELEVTDLAFNGKAVAHLNGKVVFLDGGLPGELVEAEIVHSRPRFDQARLRRIVRKSPERIEARCQHFEHCGGCTWQDLDYAQQLRFKQKQVADCLERLGDQKDVEVWEIIGSDRLFYYRNKMEFSFDVADDGGYTLGLHRRGCWDEIFDLTECHLQSETSNRLVACVRSFVASRNIPVYDVRRHTGFMRFLVIRETAHTGQVMVNLVTASGEVPAAQEIVAQVTDEFPEVTTIVHNETDRKANVATGDRETVLWGPGYIEEQLFQARFRIRANSFFQTNSRQAERLYRMAFDMLEAGPSDRVLDLYCGTGSIGILLADSVAEVVGVEIVGEAVRAATENAEINGITNISFHENNVRDFLRENREQPGSVDIVIVDPPRAGLNPRVLKQIASLRPPKLLYISCNPSTFARDTRQLRQFGYRLPAVQPIDMFPHTMHIELVGRLELT